MGERQTKWKWGSTVSGDVLPLPAPCFVFTCPSFTIVVAQLGLEFLGKLSFTVFSLYLFIKTLVDLDEVSPLRGPFYEVFGSLCTCPWEPNGPEEPVG